MSRLGQAVGDDSTNEDFTFIAVRPRLLKIHAFFPSPLRDGCHRSPDQDAGQELTVEMSKIGREDEAKAVEGLPGIGETKRKRESA